VSPVIRCSSTGTGHRRRSGATRTGERHEATAP
jgi:hypothetical protein